MHPLVVHVLQSLGTAVIEVSVKAAVDAVARPSQKPAADPVQQGVDAMDAFLRAIQQRDMERFTTICDPAWALLPETAALMDHTFASAPPEDWSFEELYAPDGWAEGDPLPWLVAELPVRFRIERAYQTVPTVLRVVATRRGWLVDHLEWGQAEPPLYDSLGDLFSFERFEPIIFQDVPSVIACPACGQKLRVPTDRGRLRVTCPRCRNVQWFEP